MVLVTMKRMMPKQKGLDSCNGLWGAQCRGAPNLIKVAWEQLKGGEVALRPWW